jgi:hypothetical protein
LAQVLGELEFVPSLPEQTADAPRVRVILVIASPIENNPDWIPCAEDFFDPQEDTFPAQQAIDAKSGI